MRKRGGSPTLQECNADVEKWKKMYTECIAGKENQYEIPVSGNASGEYSTIADVRVTPGARRARKVVVLPAPRKMSLN